MAMSPSMRIGKIFGPRVPLFPSMARASAEEPASGESAPGVPSEHPTTHASAARNADVQWRMARVLGQELPLRVQVSSRADARPRASDVLSLADSDLRSGEIAAPGRSARGVS